MINYRPNEGVLLVNVELSPIAAPKFEAGRMSDEGVEINRFKLSPQSTSTMSTNKLGGIMKYGMATFSEHLSGA